MQIQPVILKSTLYLRSCELRLFRYTTWFRLSSHIPTDTIYFADNATYNMWNKIQTYYPLIGATWNDFWNALRAPTFVHKRHICWGISINNHTDRKKLWCGILHSSVRCINLDHDVIKWLWCMRLESWVKWKSLLVAEGTLERGRTSSLIFKYTYATSTERVKWNLVWESYIFLLYIL